MNIVHTVAPAEVGGLEDVVLRLCGGLRSRGHEVTVVSIHDTDPHGHPFLEALRSTAGVDVEVIVVPARGYLSEVRRVRAICDRLRPDVLHTHGFRPCVLHPLAVRGMAVALVATLHGFTGGSRKNRFYEWLQIRSVARMDAAVAVSEPLANRLRTEGVPPEVLHLVRNAWESPGDLRDRSGAREALGVPPDAFHIGWVGRLSREKGPDLLIESLGVLQDLSSVRTSFIGDGPMRPELEARSREMGLGGVTFHGAIPNARELFSAFDVFVLSSRTEGTPIVLLEAMGAGVPVIATRVGGVPDVVGPESALLVPPDDAAGLAGAIESVVRAREAAAARAREARTSLDERFAVDPWLDRYEAIYRAVAREGS